MGGYGSGRWRTGKDVVEDCRILDINRLVKEKGLTGNRFLWCWCNDKGEAKASIRINPEMQRVRLQYMYSSSQQKVEMDYLVSLIYVPVGYGKRPYFLCPNCGTHCLKLYMNSLYFTCRKCAGLVYNCQREKEEDRAMRRARKIRRKIGASMSMMDSIYPWDKPKRMRWDTYLQLKSQAEQYESKGWRIIANKLRIRIGEEC